MIGPYILNTLTNTHLIHDKFDKIMTHLTNIGAIFEVIAITKVIIN